MTDDKEIKFIMPFKRKKSAQMWNYNIEKDLKIISEGSENSKLNEISIIVHKQNHKHGLVKEKLLHYKYALPSAFSQSIEPHKNINSLSAIFSGKCVSVANKHPKVLSKFNWRKKSSIDHTKFIINNKSVCDLPKILCNTRGTVKKSWTIYRCQFTKEESCCCSCNSDAMFEVMKSLYDCYKKKNCDHCNCILCGHLPREERRLGEKRKSGAELASVGVGVKEKKKRSTIIMEGKTIDEKVKSLKEAAIAGKPLPEGKTKSEKSLIKKVTTDLGLPPPSKTKSEKEIMKKAYAQGIITPLEGKSKADKEKILKKQADFGVPLPKGRTISEKSLIKRIQTSAPTKKVASEKLRKAKAQGFLTPLDGKSPEQREKVLRGLAMQGVPLPKGKTDSERKIIEKVRHDVGLPPEPETASQINKYNNALATGMITPLEGKSKFQKENILKEQAKIGIQLPRGRTDSEKAMIARIKESVQPVSDILGPSEKISIPSAKMKKAKAEGLITPLAGKTPKEKEKLIRGLAMNGIPLPKAKTDSERVIIDKVRKDLGIPPEPTTKDEKKRYKKAVAAGVIVPLEGRSRPEKEKLLQEQADLGISLPEGRTASEKAIIAKIKQTAVPPMEVVAPSEISIPSAKMRKAKAEGLVTPLKGKTAEQKEKILRGLAINGIPLPKPKTASEVDVIEKVRQDLGLPPEPKSKDEKTKYKKAVAAGLIIPLEGKSKAEKEKLLQEQADLGISLPEGRTASEKAIIAKIRAKTKPPSEEAAAISIPSEKLRKAKAEGFMTPLTGKSPKEREKIIRGLAMNGIPLPKGKTDSERKIIEKVRQDLGLPPEPKTADERKKYKKALADGLIVPLEGKSRTEKEKMLQDQADHGISLPEGRTASEKAIIAKIKGKAKRPSEVSAAISIPSEKLRKAKAEGLVTPLTGKTPKEKEKIIRGMAMNGIPLPKGKTDSERTIIKKVRQDLGLPPEPKTADDKIKYKKAVADGLIVPLEGKSRPEKEKLLQEQADLGITLPEGRTASEKALIAKIKAKAKRPSEVSAAISIPSEKMRKAKAEGLVTPLTGKTPKQREKIIRGLAMTGIPLPKGKTDSERKIIEKVRQDLGLPPEPKTADDKVKYKKAIADGLIVPLEGKSRPEKEKLLQEQADLGISLPEGRTASEKAIIAKLKGKAKRPSEVSAAISIPSEKMRKAKAEGLVTPLTGKSPKEREKIIRGLAMTGIPLPKGKTDSERKIIEKVRQDLGLPPEPKTADDKVKYKKAIADGLIVPLEGKSRPEKEKLLQEQADLGISLPEGRTASEKAIIAKLKGKAKRPSEVSAAISIPSEKMRKAKAEGLVTPLTGKSPKEREKIIRGLAMTGIPLPKGKTDSERKIIEKVRQDLGLPPEPKTADDKVKYKKAIADGLIVPLEGKSRPEKEQLLQEQADLGISLPEGRTASEKAIIAKLKGKAKRPSEVSAAISIPSEKMRKAKAEGLVTPLTGKTPKQREKIIRGLAMTGIPLPKGKTDSERKIIEKVRQDLGLPPEPKTTDERKIYKKAVADGLIVPLEGKSRPEKEKLLQDQADLGISLPEGRTASEKAIIAKIRAKEKPPSEEAAVISIPSEKLRKAKAEGLVTPLTGKSPKEREKIIRGLAMTGIPLPKGKTNSERKIIEKVRQDLGLPPEPKTADDKIKYKKAIADGLIVPLEGKSRPEKEKLLQEQADLGITLPEGRTASEKAIIAKIKAKARQPSEVSVAISVPSAKIKKAKAEGLLTPLTGKTPKQKEKIIRGLAMTGIPLPKGKTDSERKIIEKVRQDLGLPPEPKTADDKVKYKKAIADGLIVPLEGKSRPEKEKLLQEQADLGISLPEGRTVSEKALIAKIKEREKQPSKVSVAISVPSEKLKKAKAEGLLTPLTGKTPKQREKIIRGLAMTGIPLPKGKTDSERKIIEKVRQDLGLPPEPKTTDERKIYKKAVADGLIVPLEGKSRPEKEKMLQEQADLGISLPEGRTASEKAIIAKLKAKAKPTSEVSAEISVPSEKLRKAKAEGLVTPLTGKSPKEREKIIRGLAMNGIPLPKGKTDSERKIIEKVRQDLGLPPEPKTADDKVKYKKAIADGLIVPLEGKSRPEKEKLLQEQADLGISLPEGRTASEKAIIAKLKGKAKRPSEVSAAISIPSEKMRKAKAEGLVTPLTGKSPKEREKIIRGLAMTGIPLPKGKTDSERKIIEKVRQDLGLPPEPKTADDKIKYKKAIADGLIVPLEGKSRPEKEKLLQNQADLGISLPEGRTASEKALIAKVKEKAKLPSEVSVAITVPSEKLKKAKAEGLLTPLTGKAPKEREKIIRNLAMNGIPLPKGKTDSERKIIEKVRQELGLPPEPKTAAEKETYKKATAAGLITPLEKKTTAQKEKLLMKQAELGVSLPEGRTPSEKAIIARIKETLRPKPDFAVRSQKVQVSSEKLRKAKAEGVITPLEGKTKTEKEKILKGLAMNGIPLPEGKTISENDLIAKVRDDVGLPPAPVNLTETEKYNKGIAAGIITPLEGKSMTQKEKILKEQAALGILLPKGRTPSEKSLINKLTATPKGQLVAKMPKEKRERILKDLALQGKPLPKATTPSEKKIIEKVRHDLGLPPEPKSKVEKDIYSEAQNAGLIVPLEGKSKSQKEILLQRQANLGLQLPEPRTASEKKLMKKVKSRKRKRSKILSPEEIRTLETKTAKIMTEGKGPSDECICDLLTPESEKPSIVSKARMIPSEKYRSAKEAGLLTPLKGKSSEQKEKILRDLAMKGIPLPKAETVSDKNIIDKVRKDIGLPPEPKSSSLREKYQYAQAAGMITPLQGKTAIEKKNILTKQAELGITLPEGRTQSEKELINKIHEAVPKKVTSERLRKAKTAGLLTPITGKPSKEKERILRTLASEGFPLPEGKTASDKKLIQKIKSEMAITAVKIPSDKIRKAKAAGLLTPLQGKSDEQKEKIVKDLALLGIPLPKPQTSSEKKIIDKIRKEVGLPPEPKTSSIRTKYRQAQATGIITPLEGKSASQKEKILFKQAEMGIPMPEGRTQSEKELIHKVRTALPKKVASERLRKAKAAGLLTPLDGKSLKEKEKILKSLAKSGLPLPEAKTVSEKQLIQKVRTEMGVPLEGIPSEKLRKVQAEGLITPLEGKSPAQKEKIIKGRIAAGLPLPEAITPSDKELIKKMKSQKLRTAKSAGVLTPLHGKTDTQKEKIVRDLALQGLPLPRAQTPSEKKVIDKVRKNMGLPPEPKTSSVREKYQQAQEKGFITPLEGKSTGQKEKIIGKLAEMGIPLPEGRTQSEKDLINKVRTVLPKRVPTEKLEKAKAAGLLTPLEGKSLKQKEKILKSLAKSGLPLPEGKSASEKQLITQVQKEMGIPLEGISSEKLRKAQAAGLITPLEGKTALQKEKILKGRIAAGLPLPVGVTPSDKELVKKVKTDTGYVSPPKSIEKVKLSIQSEKAAKEAGLLTPLKGKSPEQREKIIKELAKRGIPLPKPATASEKYIIDKVRKDIGLPPEPKSSSIREKYQDAHAIGIMTPLEGKTPAEKAKILTNQAEMGIPLPEGRTKSEKDLINKIRSTVPKKVTSENLQKAKAAGLLTPITGKPLKEKERILRTLASEGLPLPEGKTTSEKQLIRKIRSEIGIPPEKLRKAKDAGLLTPLHGKTDAQKEKLVKGLVSLGIPLPKAQTASEKKIIDKVRKEVGLPPEPKTSSIKDKYRQAQEKGIITPLEGKSTSQKEKILIKQAEMGIPLPEGRTESEKDLIDKVRTTLPKQVASERLRRAKEAGLLTPLEGKSFKEKEKILKSLAKSGLPLPEGKSASEKQLIQKVRTDMGVSLEGMSSDKLRKAQIEGLITPLEGKPAAEKEKILKGRMLAGLPLPEGKTASDKELLKKLKTETGYVSPELEKKKVGLVTPRKEKILKDMALHGKPLPAAKTASEKRVMDKVRRDIGLPPEPTSTHEKDNYSKAIAAGIIQPLEGKTQAQKEKILNAEADMGLELPEGRTSSEKSLIKRIKSKKRKGAPEVHSEKIKKMDIKTAKVMKEGKGPSDECICGLLTPEEDKEISKTISEKLKSRRVTGPTPLQGKTDEQKEKIIRDLALQSIPLPEPETESEKKIIDKVRTEVGLPPEPKTSSIREKYQYAQETGIVTPLEGKTAVQKEEILTKQAEMGIPLPIGRTQSEKDLIHKISATVPKKVTSEKLRKAKAAGLLTPITGKPSDEKERILRTLVSEGLPLPEGKTASEKQLIQKLKSEKVPTIPSEKLKKAKAAGLLTPLHGKTDEQKEKIVRELALQGIPLPKPQTASEKKIIDKVKTEVGLPPEPKTSSIRQKYREALELGVVTPLEGKSSSQKEKILTKQVEMGIPLPEGRTKSEKDLISKVIAKTSTKLRKSKEIGVMTPLAGKTAEEKERIIRDLAKAGLPLPEGKTASEKSLVKKVRVQVGLPPEPTPSEKKARTKSRKVGISKAKKSEIGIGVRKSKAGIVEEFEDIVKTTTCDRGCGCDRKKIRFKHSYVKIRVTSPDISSLCPCPDECVPGVKGGVITDNEGIKVTVGQVMGTASFRSTEIKKHFETIRHTSNTSSNIKEIKNAYKSSNQYHNYINGVRRSSSYSFYKKYNNYYKSSTSNEGSSHHDKIKESDTNMIASESIEEITNIDSIESFYYGKTNSSISLKTKSSLNLYSEQISVISVSVTNVTTSSSISEETDIVDYLYCKSKAIKLLDFLDNEYYKTSKYSDTSNGTLSSERKTYRTVFSVSAENIYASSRNSKKTKISKSQQILKVLDEIVSKSDFTDSSSAYYVIMSSSTDFTSSFSNSLPSKLSSTICIQLSENYSSWESENEIDSRQTRRSSHSTGFKLVKGRKYDKNIRIINNNKSNIIQQGREEVIDMNMQQKKYNIGTDTTQDRPCCCIIDNKNEVGVQSPSRNTNVFSEIVTPFMISEAIAQGLNEKAFGHTFSEASWQCRIPPGSGYIDCHSNRMRTPARNSVFKPFPNQTHTESKSCQCDFGKLIEVIENMGKELISTACGSSQELACRRPGYVKPIIKKTHWSPHDSIREFSQEPINTELECGTCSKPSITEFEKLTCLCGGQKKEIIFGKKCPCEEHALPKEHNHDEDDSKCRCKNKEKGKNKTKGKRKGKKDSTNSKNICECPPPEPEEDFDPIMYIDERKIRKFKSEMTQSMSGFKLNKIRKSQESEMSLDEALKFLAMNYKKMGNNEINEDACSCDSDLEIHDLPNKPMKVDCICPPTPNEPVPAEEPFRGIKLHIGGKGSASKGLSGVLCFEVHE